MSSEKRDPDLDVGGSYFTEDEPFRDFLRSVTDQREVWIITVLYLKQLNEIYRCRHVLGWQPSITPIRNILEVMLPLAWE